MAAGHIVYGQCVDVAESLDLYWGQKGPEHAVFPSSSGSSYTDMFVYEKVGGVWQMTTWLNAPSLPFISKGSKTVPAVSFASCEYQPALSAVDSFVDGHFLGWGVVAAMAAAWAVHQLRRAAT